MTARRFRPYPSYKDTGIEWLGKIPEQWGVKRLKYAAVIVAGQSPPSNAVSSDGEGLPFLQGNAEFGPRHPSPQFVCDTVPKRAEEGDFLLSVRAPVGALNTAERKYGIGRGLCAIRPTEVMEKGYAFYLLLAVRGALDVVATGSTFEAVAAGDVGGLPSVQPPLPEQRSIAAFLDRETQRIDTLVEKKERLVELLHERRTALISHAVTKGLDPNVRMKDSGVEWLGKIPEHWRTGLKLSYLAVSRRGAFTNGPFGSDLLTTELVGSGVPVIYIGDIGTEGYCRARDRFVTKGKAIELDAFRVDPGDVLIAKVGDPPGFACVYPDTEPPGVVTQDVVRIKVRQSLSRPRYLSMLLNSSYGGALVDLICVESTRNRFSFGDYRGIRIALPPVAEQDAIADYLDRETKRIDAMLEKVRRSVELLKEYRTALISAAVTGKIDVRDAA